MSFLFLSFLNLFLSQIIEVLTKLNILIPLDINHNICRSTVDRTNKLHNKVKLLNECLVNNTEIEISEPANGPGLVNKKQSLFYKDTRPSAVSLHFISKHR